MMPSDSSMPCGARIAGTGSAVPVTVWTNDDLAKTLDTSDEWITQRTGIRERHVCIAGDESAFSLQCEALSKALDDAGMKASELDLIIVASVTNEMTCPSNACRVAAELDAAPAGAFDLVAACSGFVYSLNLADSLIRTGRHRAIGIVGCDAMSNIVDFNERTVSVLFGDAAGAAVIVRDDDPNKGCVYQTLQADGSGWKALFLPRKESDVPPESPPCDIEMGFLRMEGREVYRFAVSKFKNVIEDAMQATGLGVDDVSQFICHQSNIRIIESAKEKLGLPDDKVYVNIDRYGNTSAGSVGLCLDEIRRAGKIHEGETIILVAFGGGLTWASSVWNL
ncbi:MAG: ketoacyl-ACP synthase III [Phycisphaerales bacterium]|nr:ketoacyl-ACP synthase III [Phycisphaerales bacterium]